ncbi:PCI domain-containing protein [Babesia ovata]|uniref:PCI domain-containing protein n=1 Tax=Babesia ovata TaxID=189622 RepID=A0A2H6KFJ4_9APIC|nr:PCI domain-containing protein [Babesia ovata]GBE61761.1 PCI domain-containing protein [Babesia ovata]
MTTFVPLSPDTEGAVSSAALGDWILSIIKVREPSKTADYYSKLLNQFQEVDGEQVIKDSFQLFELLLSGNEMVFAFLDDAMKGETTVIAIDPNTKEEVELQVKYNDALKQVEEYFTVLMYMLQLRFTSNAQIEKAGNLLLKAIAVDDSCAELRLRLLQMLYNSVDATLPLRVVVYTTLLEFAARNDIFHTLIPVIQKLDDWMKDWALDNSTKIHICRIISEQLDKMGKTDMAYKYWEKRIECCDTIAMLTPENIDAAAHFCIRSIKAPDVLYFDRLRMMPAMEHLGRTKYAVLKELLDLLVEGNNDDLEAIVAKHGEENLEALGVPIDICRWKIQLLTLATICQNEPHVPIARVQQKLRLTREQVEELVVTAITKGVIDGLIDQKSEQIIIRSVMQRHFGAQQLKQLHSNLVQWKDCITNLMAVLGNHN